MKVVFIFLVILGIIVAFSAFDYFSKNWKFPDSLRLVEKKEATVSKPISSRALPLPEPISKPSKTGKKENLEKENEKKSTNISPYFGKVKFSKIQAKNYYHPSLITLSYNLIEGDKINITGWQIKTRKGEFIIPKAIEKYQTHQTPRNIIIENYGRIYLINKPNPLGKNRNFRLNKCMGYLANSRDFYPSFYTYCPKPKLEEISHLNPYCQEFILNLSNCEIPNYSNNLKIAIDSQCTSYLRDNLNYNGCLKNHSKDNNFLKNYWYVYLNTDIVEKLHDTIYLLDPNGLIVDKYIY